MSARSAGFLVLAIGMLSGVCAPAHAAITVFDTQAAFAGATTAPGVDTFTGFSVTGSTPSPITRAAGPYTYTGAVTTTSFFGAGTTADPWLSTNTATDTITFNAFSGGVSAVGGQFFGSNSAGQFLSGNITLVATDSLGATATRTITGAPVSSFLGFVSTGTITSLTVTTVQPASGFLWPTVDNLTLGLRAPFGITVYESEAAFLAAISARGVDTYTGFSIISSTPSPITRAAPPYSYTGAVTTTAFFGAGTTGNPWLSTNTATDTITFNNFSGGAAAVGGNFFGSNSSGLFASGNITLVGTDSLGATATRTIAAATTSSFLGFVSTGPMTSLTVTSVQPSGGGFLWPTVDNLTLGVVSRPDPVFQNGFE